MRTPSVPPAGPSPSPFCHLSLGAPSRRPELLNQPCSICGAAPSQAATTGARTRVATRSSPPAPLKLPSPRVTTSRRARAPEASAPGSQSPPS